MEAKVPAEDPLIEIEVRARSSGEGAGSGDSESSLDPSWEMIHRDAIKSSPFVLSKHEKRSFKESASISEGKAVCTAKGQQFLK